MPETKTRMPVEHYGLIPPPKRGVRKFVDGEAIALSRYYPREHAPLRHVNLAGVRATQPSVRKSSIRRHSMNPGRSVGFWGDNEPYLLIRNGQRYLWDGHHRTCVVLSQSITSMVMRVMDLDDPVVLDLLRTVRREHAEADERERKAATARLGAALDRHYSECLPALVA